MPNIDAWAETGSAYGASHPRQILATGAMVLVLASLLAWCGDRVLRSDRTELYLGPGVWVYALHERPAGTVAYLGVVLQDGTLVEEVLHSFSLRPPRPATWPCAPRSG